MIELDSLEIFTLFLVIIIAMCVQLVFNYKVQKQIKELQKAQLGSQIPTGRQGAPESQGIAK